MTHESTIKQELSEPPSAPALYWRALMRKPARTRSLPAVELSLRRQRAESDRIARYNHTCGFADGPELAPIFPHVLAFPLHMALMTRADFPFPLLGLVHLANRITRRRPIGTDELLDIRCRFGELAPHAKGTTFSVITSVTTGGQRVWEGTSTLLRRHAVTEGERKSAAPLPDEIDNSATRASWRVPANIGRRYARASGDWNPIHLHALTARLFGFPRAIAHGMWSKARCVAALMPVIGTRPFTVDVEFKAPILLPAAVNFRHQADDAGVRFALRDRAGVKPHLSGTLRFLDR